MLGQVNVPVLACLGLLVLLVAVSLFQIARPKKPGTTNWETPAKQSGTDAKWKWLALGLAGWALFSGGRFFSFTNDVEFTSTSADGSVRTHEVQLPHNGAAVKARFLLPDGSPAQGGLAHVERNTPKLGGSYEFSRFSAADESGTVLVSHYEEWLSTFKVAEPTPYTVRFMYRDDLSNTVYLYENQLPADGERLRDIGDIKLGETGHDLTFKLYLNGEPYTGRATIRGWDSESPFAPRLTGTGDTYRIVGIPTVEEGGKHQLSFNIQLLDARYPNGANVSRLILLEAGKKLERVAVITENFRID
ncbi:MAG: hypothetical protein M5U25_08625 [Planctomycetota bacterium]|nr:hypothetical protein [Planctomycetota bacterium]